MKTETLNAAWDPKTGVCYAERLGEPVTIEELIAATGYRVDEVRVVPGSVETKAWPTSMKLERRDEETGKVIQSEPIQVWNHYTRIKLEPLHDEVLSRQVQDDLLAEIRAEKAGKHDPHPRGSRSAGAVVPEYDVFDPHFQLLAWGPETSQNHDLSIIAGKYREAIADMRGEVHRMGYPIKRSLLTVGQDLFHSDRQAGDGSGGATSSGTIQDVDTRLAKAAKVVRRMLTDIVLDLLEDGPVDIMVVPGNHDTERSWWMGEVLDARFEGNPSVRVDNRPMMRKYYRVGNTLIGFSHGHNLKHQDFRDLMSQEAREDWGDTVFREWHVGHLHHEEVKDVRGIVVRQLPSLAGTDAWHFNKGYVHAQQGARTFIWTMDRGLRTTVHHNILRPDAQEFTRPLLRGDD